MLKAILVAALAVRSYFEDKGDMAFGLLLPIAIFALMYSAFGGQTMFHGTAYVVNEDEEGTYSTILLEQLDKLELLDIELLSRTKADTRLKRSDLLLALYIPAGFSDKLAAGEPVELAFKQRGNGGQEGQIVAAIVRGVVEEINQEFEVRSQVNDALTGKGISEDRIETTVEKFLEREHEHPIVGISEETVGSSPDMVNQFLPGIITMFILFSVSLSARFLVEERRLGTLERLLTTRLSVGQLFIGKFLASMSRGFIQILILLLLSYAVFQLFTPFTFLEALVIALIFIAAASTIGLIIGSVARSEDQATWIAVVITMTMVMAGGTFFEIAEGSVFEIISRASINTYANNAFRTLMTEGGSLADLGLELGVLAGVIVVGLGVSRVLFKVMPGGR